MKKHFLILCAFASTSLVQAQSTWNTNGSTVLTTTPGSVGIGTITPAAPLHVRQDFTGSPIMPSFQNPVFQIDVTDNSNNHTDNFIITYEGKVGIGIAQPTEKLQLNGGTLLLTNAGTEIYQGSFNMHNTANNSMNLYNTPFAVYNGNVANFKIDANGNAWARNMKVTATAIPDYVFEKDYSLMNLAELEQYIQRNKHLPNIPSAKEYEAANGVDVGELQLKLLEKVEELTLHLIQLNKKCINLEAELTRLQQGNK